MDQEDIERVIDHHLGLFKCDEAGNTISKLRIAKSANETLKRFSYDEKVAKLIENVSTFLREDELFYELEDLYRQLEHQNQGEIYRHPMQVVLNILNEGNDQQKQVKILNELSIYNWIPSVKNFLFKYTTNPRQRSNITSAGGRADQVYSVVEKLETGLLTFIGDKWFYLKESEIEPTTPFNLITDPAKLARVNFLEKALRLGDIADDKIIFDIEEGFKLGISFKNGDIYLNDEKCDKATTLESIFESPIVPYIRKDMYPVIKTTKDNLDKFVELDIVTKISNITNPFLECFAFNYKNNMYLYTIDRRVGSSFYQYDSASMIVNEMKNQLGFDLSDFYNNKFSQEVQMRRDLEGKEKLVLTKISEINENITKLEMTGLLEISEQIKIAYDALKEEIKQYSEDLTKIKKALTENKKIVR